MLEYHAKRNRIASLNMKNELRGHLLLRQAKLDGLDRNIIIGTPRGDYLLKASATSMQNDYCNEGLPPSLMAASGAGCYPRKQIFHCTSNLGFSSTTFSEQYNHKPHLFYVYMVTSGTERKDAAAIESGTCASVGGQETHDETIRQLRIIRLKDAKISKHGHHFGTAATTHKSTTAVRVLFVYEAAYDLDFTEFRIGFYVFKGDLSFLISLPSLRARKATLCFRHSNISLVVDKSLCRLNLVKHKSHLGLRLRGKYNRQRSFNESKPTYHQ